GRLSVEIHGQGRRGRYNGTRIELRCETVAVHDDQLILCSVLGPESSLKAFTASLHSDRVVEYSCRFDEPNFQRYRIGRCSLPGFTRYKAYRHRLFQSYGLWQALIVAQVAGFLP